MEHPQPTEQSICLWERARRPMGLVPITAADHLSLGNNPRTQSIKSIKKGWLDMHFPAAT